LNSCRVNAVLTNNLQIETAPGVLFPNVTAMQNRIGIIYSSSSEFMKFIHSCLTTLNYLPTVSDGALTTRAPRRAQRAYCHAQEERDTRQRKKEFLKHTSKSETPSKTMSDSVSIRDRSLRLGFLKLYTTAAPARLFRHTHWSLYCNPALHICPALHIRPNTFTPPCCSVPPYTFVRPYTFVPTHLPRLTLSPHMTHLSRLTLLSLHICHVVHFCPALHIFPTAHICPAVCVVVVQLQCRDICSIVLCIYIYVCICIYIYTYVRTCSCIHLYMTKCPCSPATVPTQVVSLYVYIYIFTHINSYSAGTAQYMAKTPTSLQCYV